VGRFQNVKKRNLQDGSKPKRLLFQVLDGGAPVLSAQRNWRGALDLGSEEPTFVVFGNKPSV